jgi:hypothetical protein
VLLLIWDKISNSSNSTHFFSAHYCRGQQSSWAAAAASSSQQTDTRRRLSGWDPHNPDLYYQQAREWEAHELAETEAQQTKKMIVIATVFIVISLYVFLRKIPSVFLPILRWKKFLLVCWFVVS